MASLTPKTIEALEGRRIVRVSATALHLDNGKAIYLEADEIESLNEHYDPETEDEMREREYKEYAENKTSYGQTPLTFEGWLHQDDIN